MLPELVLAHMADLFMVKKKIKPSHFRQFGLEVTFESIVMPPLIMSQV